MKAPRENLYRTAWAGTLRAGDVDRETRVAGWVHRRRDHGGLIFIDLRDRTGLLQLVFRPEEAPEAHAAAHGLRAEDVLTARGRIVRREEGTINPQLPTGEIELAVEELEVLADAETPPFEIDSDKAVDETLRLKYRYLDLRRDRMRDSIELRHNVIDAIRRHLNEEGFLEVETPFLTRSTPEGARDFLVPSRLQAGAFYALPQSPQLFKQLLMVAGFERYYQIVRCFRDEAARADRLPEFTQLDMEMSFIEEEDVISVCEGLIPSFLAPGGVQVEPPFDRVTYAEAMLRYGTDRPDRRLGMEIHELGDAFAGSEFKVFSGALEGGGVVRGFKTSAAELTRKRFDELTLQAQSLGAKGLVWAVVEQDGAWRSPVAKFLRPEEMSAAAGLLGAVEGDAILAVADSAEIAARVLGHLRVELAPPGGGRRPALGGRLPDVRVERGRAALRRAPPPVHLAAGGPRRRSEHLDEPGLRRRLERQRDRRRLDPHQPPRRAAQGVRRHRPHARGRPGPLRLPARRAPVRRPAPRRHRLRHRPHNRPPTRHGLDPRRDRVSEGGKRGGSADGRAGLCG